MNDPISRTGLLGGAPAAMMRAFLRGKIDMAVHPELLEILVCPETKQPIALAGADVLARINAEIDAGRLRNRGGETVKTRISEGLVREDGRILYPVDDGIPVMLIDESIELS
jgi:uncharacterized protein YbaR (Trm112 family)